MSFREKQAAALLLLRKDGGEVLLQRRQNTGYADGLWDFSCSGHVEAGESMKLALCREAAEELCIDISPTDLEFAGFRHRLKPGGEEAYLDGFFRAVRFLGVPRIGEPEKCGELRWFSRDALPQEMMSDRKLFLERGAMYGETGWEGRQGGNNMAYKDRYLTRSAVMLFLLRKRDGKQEILLQKRKNTGYGDGMWDCGCSGHVDGGESMTQAMSREAREELGISIAPEALEFATLTHKNTPGQPDAVYYNGYFSARQYEGELRINEPEKCEELRWFPLDSLPGELLEDRKMALQNFLRGIPYGEYGWNTGG